MFRQDVHNTINLCSVSKGKTAMIKLIASDIDGTLIRDGSHHINQEYMQVIPALKKKGVRFCACSGRQYSSILHLFAPIADDIYFISENGTVLRTKDKVLHTWPIAQEYLRPLMDDLRKIEGIEVGFCTPDVTYTEGGQDTALYKILKDNYKYEVEAVPDLLGLPLDNICKVTIFQETDAEAACAPIYNSDWNNKLRITCSGKVWVDICAMEAGKGEAYALLQEYLDIPKEETVYFGDNMNDLTAFDETGVSYTVANARSEVQDSADIVMGSFQQDGVLTALKTILIAL